MCCRNLLSTDNIAGYTYPESGTDHTAPQRVLYNNLIERPH